MDLSQCYLAHNSLAKHVHRKDRHCVLAYSTPSNSTSKIKVALGGMVINVKESSCKLWCMYNTMKCSFNIIAKKLQVRIRNTS